MATPTNIFTTICVTTYIHLVQSRGHSFCCGPGVHGSGKKHKYAIGAYYSTEFNCFSQAKNSVICSPALYNRKCILNFVR